MFKLPIEIVLPDLRTAFSRTDRVILSAEPGAGKTTKVAPALLHEEWLGKKKIIMLEPRRLAVVRAAEYMSLQIDEKVGGTIGYRIRGDNRIGKQTRIEIVTEGILTRMLQSDPAIPEIGLLIFDEFHERSIHADLGLALSLDVQENLRDDLKILIMSATLDVESITELLGDSAVIKSKGRSFPVTTHYLPQAPAEYIESLTANAVVRSLHSDEGDILVFLPGEREIRKVESLLLEKINNDRMVVHALYGNASPEKQQAALVPSTTGKRKVILSTNIAETSITIEGISIVIDSGLARSSRFDARRGMSGLITIPVSQASAEQRKGRAGRERPGICYRLWTEIQHTQLPHFSRPEILLTDLAPLALDLAVWGDADGKNLKFLDPPPQSNLMQAQDLLKFLGALDEKGKITEHGKRMDELAVHPRLAHMLLTGKENDLREIACDVAALLEERDVLRGKRENEVDLHSRYMAVKEKKVTDRNIIQRIEDHADRLKKNMGYSSSGFGRSGQGDKLGLLLALVYPDRIAKRISGDRYQLSGSSVGSLPKGSILFKHEYLAVGEVDGAGREVKIFLAEPVTENNLLSLFKEQIRESEEHFWDEKSGSVTAKRVKVIGSVELLAKIISPEAAIAENILIGEIKKNGLDFLPWDQDSISLRTRSEWLRKQELVFDDWKDVSNDHLLETIDEWCAPFLKGMVRRSQVQKLSMKMVLQSFISHKQFTEIERLAPTHITVPTGSKIAVDYTNDQPILAVRLQEMFGETETPAVGGGKKKVLLHLLSPARRPIAVTQDLPSFWKNAYPDVRKDMRGQYPKHYWPENPLEAEPTKKTKKYMK